MTTLNKKEEKCDGECHFQYPYGFVPHAGCPLHDKMTEDERKAYSQPPTETSWEYKTYSLECPCEHGAILVKQHMESCEYYTKPTETSLDEQEKIEFYKLFFSGYFGWETHSNGSRNPIISDVELLKKYLISRIKSAEEKARREEREMVSTVIQEKIKDFYITEIRETGDMSPYNPSLRNRLPLFHSKDKYTNGFNRALKNLEDFIKLDNK